MYQLNTSFPMEGYMESRIGGRAENQDSCAFSDTPIGSLAIVCDGMGGLRGGSTASSLAVNKIVEVFHEASRPDDPVEVIKDAVLAANALIIETGQKQPELLGMGTTLTLLLIRPDCAYAAYAGDSRIYQLRSGKKIYRSFDDSVVFQFVKMKSLTEEQARTAGNSNVITKAMGISHNLDFEVFKLPYDKNDRFILCTDGFWGNMPEKDFLDIVAKKDDLEMVMERSFNKVEKEGLRLKQGNHDNLTAIMIDVRENSQIRSKMERFFKLASCCLLILLVGSVCLNVSQNRTSKQYIKDAEVEMASLHDNYRRAAAYADSMKVASEEANRYADLAIANAKRARDAAKAAAELSKNDKSLKEKADKLRKEAETKEAEAKRAADEAKSKAAEAEKAEKASKAEKAILDRENQKLKSENEGMEKTIRDLEKQNADLKKDRDAKSEELEGAQKRIKGLESEKEKLVEEQKKLIEQLNSKKESVTPQETVETNE